MLRHVRYQWRSLKDEELATAANAAEARRDALLAMRSKGIQTAKLYYRATSDQPWHESDAELLEDSGFDSDFPR